MTAANAKIPKKVIATIIATGIMSFCGVIVETAMNIAFPTLMREFQLSTNSVQCMTSIYLLIISIVVPLSAALKISFKTKHLFLAANILFFCGLFIDALAPSFPVLILGRAIQGLGTGIALPLMFNIILEQVPRGKVAIMSPLGGRLLDRYGARRPLMIGTSLMLIEQLLFALFIPHASNSLIALVYILYMGGMGLSLSNVMTDALEPFTPADKMAGNAILNTVQQFAGAVGTSLCSAIVAFSQQQAGTKSGMPTAWGSQHAYCFLLILNLLVIWLLTRRTKAS